MTYPARSPLPGEEEAGGPKTAAPPGDAADADLKRLTVRLPADVVEGLSSAAHGEGTSRGLLIRRLVEAGLRNPPEPEQAVVLPGSEGRPTMVHQGALREVGDGEEIPAGYTAPPPESPTGGKAAADEEEPDPEAAEEPGNGRAANGRAGNGRPRAEPGPAAARPAVPASDPAPAVPGSVLFQAPPTALQPAGKLFRFALVTVLLVGVLALVGGLVAQRYQLHAPDPGAYGAGVYLVDRWSGRVWFCDSAQRGLPARVCVPFVLGRPTPLQAARAQVPAAQQQAR